METNFKERKMKDTYVIHSLDGRKFALSVNKTTFLVNQSFTISNSKRFVILAIQYYKHKLICIESRSKQRVELDAFNFAKQVENLGLITKMMTPNNVIGVGNLYSYGGTSEIYAVLGFIHHEHNITKVLLNNISADTILTAEMSAELLNEENLIKHAKQEVRMDDKPTKMIPTKSKKDQYQSRGLCKNETFRSLRFLKNHEDAQTELNFSRKWYW